MAKCLSSTVGQAHSPIAHYLFHIVRKTLSEILDEKYKTIFYFTNNTRRLKNIQASKNIIYRYKSTIKIFLVKLLRATGGCLGINRRRRTRKPAISSGELEKSIDPEISEWGNPIELTLYYLNPKTIKIEKQTFRTETSK